MGRFKHGTVVYNGMEYARGLVNGRVVLYPLEDGKLKKKTRFVYEHRLVYELSSGEKLADGDVVHHINGDKTDNRPENLEKMNNSAHSKKHVLERARANNYRIGPFYCVDCGAEITHKAKRCVSCSRKARTNPNRPTKEGLEKMAAVKSNTEIAAAFGVSEASVRKWRKKFGV